MNVRPKSWKLVPNDGLQEELCERLDWGKISVMVAFILRLFFLRLLIVEVGTVVAVIAIFRLVPERKVAAVIAGLLFVGLGAWIAVKGLREREFRRSLTFWAGLVHLFVAALPIFLVRLMNWNADFSSLHVWGLGAPEFHKFSSYIFMVLLGATSIDVARAFCRHLRPANDK